MKGYVTFIFIQLQLELLIVSCISVYGFFAFRRSEKVSEHNLTISITIWKKSKFPVDTFVQLELNSHI